MDESLISIHGAINDLSALDIENITCCLRIERCVNAALRELSSSNSNTISESTLLSLRDHFYCRLPALAEKIMVVFQVVAKSESKNLKTEKATSHLVEIREAYLKVLAQEIVHSDCANCASTCESVRNVFDLIHGLLSRSTSTELPQLLVTTDDNLEPRCSSAASNSMEEPIYAGLEESVAYPELCTSLALSRYSEISHADDWRLYFEDSDAAARSAKKQMASTARGRSRSAEDLTTASAECQRQRQRQPGDLACTPLLPSEHGRRHQSSTTSPVANAPPDSPDRFRWDDYDLKQPLVGDNSLMATSSSVPVKRVLSTGDLSAREPRVELVSSNNNNKSLSHPEPGAYYLTPSGRTDKPPIKLDGLSAEILSATIRRLRIAEQRVSVLEAYNNQLRDENHSMVRRFRQSEELVAALRQQVLSTADSTAKQMEDILSSQLMALKTERDNLLETVERLKPLQIQLAGANFEKRLLTEAMEQESKAAAQWRRDRETLETTLFSTQAMVQRQRVQLAESDQRQSELSAIIADLTAEKEEISNRLSASEATASSALLRAERLGCDLEAVKAINADATKKIDQLRSILANRDTEIVKERERWDSEHAVAIDNLRRQLATEVKSKEEQHKKDHFEVEKLRAELDKAYEQSKIMESERTAALMCIKRIHERELNDIYENHLQELAVVRSEMAVKSEAVAVRLREEVEAAHLAELADLKTKHEEELREHLAEQRKQLEVMFVSQFEAQSADHERIVAESIAKCEAKSTATLDHCRQVERECNETIERLGRDLEAALANQAQMLNSMADQETVVLNMRTRLEEQAQELEAALIERTSLLSQIEQMRQSLESFTEGQVAAAVENVRTESEIHMEQLSGQLELAKRQLDDTHQLLVMAGQHNSDLRAAMCSQQQSHAAQLDQQRNEMTTMQQRAASLDEQLNELQSKYASEVADLKKQIGELTKERSNMKPVVKTFDVACSAGEGDGGRSESAWMELETRNRILGEQLAVLYEESKRIQDEMAEMHLAEMDKANFNYIQKMNEIKMAMQESVAQLKRTHEAELKMVQEEWQRRQDSEDSASDHSSGACKQDLKDEYEAKMMLLKQQGDLEREAAIMKEREVLLADHAITIRQLKAEWEIELKRWQFEVETAQTSLRKMTEERDHLEQRLNNFVAEKNEMETKIRVYCSTIEEQRQEFTRRLEVEHKDLRNEFEQMLENVSSKLELEAQLKRANFFIDFQQRYDAKVAELVALREQYTSALSKADARIAELQQLADQYVEEKLELEQKFSRERSEFRQEIDRITSNSAEQLRTVVRETEDRLTGAHQAEVKQILQKCEDERCQQVGSISAKYEDEIQSLTVQLNEKMEQQLKELSKQTAAIDLAVTENYREKLAAEIAQIERNLALEFRQREAEAQSELDQAHEVEIGRVEESWHRRVEEVESHLAVKNEECQKVKAELKQVQESSKRMAELMASDYEQQLARAVEDTEAKARAEFEITLGREKERVRQQMIDERDAVETELRGELDNLRGKASDLEHSLMAVQRTLAEVIKARDDAIQAAKLAANELVVTSGHSLGVFRLLTCLVQHVQSLITERTEQMISRPAMEGEGLIEAIAIVRERSLPSLGSGVDVEDVARPFQEVQMWLVEKFDSLLALVDAALIQSEVDHEFAGRAKLAVDDRDAIINNNQKSLITAETLIQQKTEELRRKDEEIAKLMVCAAELKEVVEKIEVELSEAQTNERLLIEERNMESKRRQQRLDSLRDMSVQCDEEEDRVAECEARWAEQAAEMDAAAARRIEETEQQMVAAIQRLDELSAMNDRMRVDYEHRLSDAAEHLATKESSLTALRKFLDEQTAEREAEQEEYQKQIISLQQTLSERLRALESANCKLAAVDEMQREMEETSRQLQSSQRKMNELQALLADTEDRLRAETGRFQSRLQSAQAEKLRLENDITRARGIISKLEARVNNNESLESSLVDSTSVNRLHQELNETRNRWEVQCTRLQTLESELKQLVEEKRDHSIKMDELKYQLEESQRKLIEAETACTSALNRFQNDIQSRERTIATLQAELNDREVQLQTLETTSRQLLNERDLGGSMMTRSTPQFAHAASPSFTVNSYGGLTAANDMLNLAEKDREIEQLRSLIAELTAERNQQVDAAESARRSLECRLANLESKLASHNGEMDARMRSVATAYERELAAVRTGLNGGKERDDDLLVMHSDAARMEPELVDTFDTESIAHPGNLSIIAADLNEKLARADKLDAVIMRRAGIDIDTHQDSQDSQLKMTTIDGSAYAGLVTPSTSGSSPSGNGSTTSPLVAILHRLEELSSEILRLSDPDTYLLSGAAEGSMMTDRLLAVLHKIAPNRSVAVGTETANICGALEEMRAQVSTLAGRWSQTAGETNSSSENNSNENRYADFIIDVCQLLDAAIDQLVSIVVNASASAEGKLQTGGNVDAVRQLVHVTTQLSSDFSGAERKAFNSDCQSLAQRVREVEAELSKERRSVHETQKQLDDLHEKLRSQSGELSHLQARLDDEQQQRLDVTSVAQKLKNQLDESYAEIERARRNSDQMHTSSLHELDDVRRAYETTVAQLREKQADIDKFDAKIASVKQVFTAQLERQQAISQRFASEVETYREKAARSASELNEARRALDIAGNERDRLQAEIDKLLTMMADQERRASDITDKLNATEAERSRLEMEMEAMRDEQVRSEMRFSAKSDATLRQLKDSMGRLEGDNERLRQELNAAEQRSSMLARDLDRAVIASSHTEDRLISLSHQLDARTNEVSKLSSRLSELEAAGITLAEFDRLKQRLSARDAACERAIEQTATLRARMAELTARITPVRSQLLLAAARANAIISSVSNSVVLGGIYPEEKASAGGSAAVAVASQLESGLRMAANELDQILSAGSTSTSSGGTVYTHDGSALSPPPQYASGRHEEDDDFDAPSTGHLPVTTNRHQLSSLLQQNKELGDQIYRLSVEIRQLRRTAANEHVSSASSTRDSAASPHDKNMLVARQQMRELTAKYVRAEGHRKALIYQKRYLMLVIGDFRDSERQILIKLRAMDQPHGDHRNGSTRVLPKSWHSRANAALKSTSESTTDTAQKSRLPPLALFRAAAASVIFVHRTRKLSKKWRKFSGTTATQMTESVVRSSNSHYAPSAAFSVAGNIRPAAHTLTQPTRSGKHSSASAISSGMKSPNKFGTTDLYSMTASSHGFSVGGYDLATATLSSGGNGAIDMGFNAADVITNDDSYLNRLEMVRSRLRECRTTSGAAAMTASNIVRR